MKWNSILDEQEENIDNVIINIVRKGGDGYFGKYFIILLWNIFYYVILRKFYLC